MKKIIISVAIVLLGIGVYVSRDYLFARKDAGAGSTSTAAVISSGATPEAIAEIPQYTYTQSYNHPTPQFSFKYPEEFTVTSVPNDDGSEVIIVQNLAKKVGVQILVSKFDGDDIDLTKDIVVSSVPDITVTDEQEVLIGANRKGIAFVSDNEAFGGKSREVWFVYKGKLYQISTYAELDEFLKGLFATWQFK